MQRSVVVLGSLRQAKPKKCAVGQREVRYLGYHLSGKQVHPKVDKTAMIAVSQDPRTKRR